MKAGMITKSDLLCWLVDEVTRPERTEAERKTALHYIREMDLRGWSVFLATLEKDDLLCLAAHLEPDGYEFVVVGKSILALELREVLKPIDLGPCSFLDDEEIDQLRCDMIKFLYSTPANRHALWSEIYRRYSVG